MSDIEEPDSPDSPDPPSPSEWIDVDNKCTICGAEVREDVNFVSSQESADLTEAEIVRLVYTKQLKLSWPTYTSCSNCFKVGSSCPTEHQLATSLLNEQFAELHEVGRKSLANSKSVTIMIDGWSRAHAGNENVVLNIGIHTGVYVGRPIYMRSNLRKHDDDPSAVSRMIGKIVTEMNLDIRSKLHAIVTDNCGPENNVTMNSVESLFHNRKVYCYGSASSAIKALANDISKIPQFQTSILSNQLIAQFFAREDVCEILLENYRDENSLRLVGTIPAGDIDVGMQAFITLRRNIKLQHSLTTIIEGCVPLRECDGYSTVCKFVKDTDDTLWASTRRIVNVFNVLANALRFCQNCNLPLSVMPHIWAHITLHLSSDALRAWGFDNSTIDSLTTKVAQKRNVNVRPVTCAAHALDPYFRGQHLNDEEWEEALDVILSLPSRDLALISICFKEYRRESQLTFARDEHLTNLQTNSYSQNQINWWNSHNPHSPLAKAAEILLAMPASIANVKRYNKSHVLQLHKSKWIRQIKQNLAVVSYNLNIKSRYDEDKDKVKKRMKDLLSLCTQQKPLIKIRKEKSDPAPESKLTNFEDKTPESKLMNFVEEVSKHLPQPPQTVTVHEEEEDSAVCGVYCPKMLALHGQPDEYNSGGYFEYDSVNNDGSLWSEECPFVSHEAYTNSNFAVFDPLISDSEIDKITDVLCSAFIPSIVEIENTGSSIGQNVPVITDGTGANLLGTQNIPIIPDVARPNNSVSQINNPLDTHEPNTDPWTSLNIDELIPEGENTTFKIDELIPDNTYSLD